MQDTDGPQPPPASHRWYAVRVKARAEKVVAASIAGRGLEPFLPLYRAKDRSTRGKTFIDLPLFTGYLFTRIDFQNRLPILTIPGVVQIVGDIPVDDAEIAAIQAVAGSDHPAKPWAFTKVGQRVVIDKGSLRDLEGILVQEKGCYRVVVSVSLLQRSVAVEIDRDMIRPLTNHSRSNQSCT